MKNSVILNHAEEVAQGIFTAEVRKWLQQGIDDYLYHGKPLLQALNLSSVHSKGAPYAARYKRFAKHLNQAAKLMPVNCSTYARAKLLKTEFDRFQLYRWPKLRGKVDAPECLSPIEREIFGAFNAMDGKVTESAQNIWKILRENSER
jgi:hypothetical protein